MKVCFENVEFDGQLLRALSYTYYAGADIGECLSTAARIADGDREGWYREWMATADRVAAAAAVSLTAGQAVSAREAYLRASNYYRTAYVFMFSLPVDTRAHVAFDRHRATFRAAATLHAPPVEPVAIPFEGTTLPGYFALAGADPARRATLLITGGYDGTAEELYAYAVGALRRGYHCLFFDGPGQGAALLEQKLYMRPDWENVVTPVVDYLYTRPEVDRQRLALMGRSWGGYLAPRAASGEHRLAACIADPGLLSPGSQAPQLAPPALREAFERGDAAAFDPGMLQAAAASPRLEFSLNRGMLVHGKDSPLAWVQSMAEYTLADRVGQIACPVLITQAENDLRASQSRALYEALPGPKQLVAFTNAEGAGEHCEAGASGLFDQRVYDWLASVPERGRHVRP